MKVNTTSLGKVALTGALVVLTFFDASAQAYDPFATIFGDAPRTIKSDNYGDADEDNILLVGVQLREYDLIEVISGYEIEDDVCVEATPIFEALKLPMAISAGRLSGWMDEQSQTIGIDLESGVGAVFGRPIDLPDQIRKIPQGWCLSLFLLSEITKIDFAYEKSTLMVRATPRKVLPIEAKLERARIRKSMQLDQDVSRPNYPVIDTPYQWFAFPTADININLAAGANTSVSQRLSIELAGDFLKTTARLRSVDNGGQGQVVRTTLGRVSERADQFGPLRARQFSIGDVSVPALPLTTKSKTGRGAIISNLSTHRPTLFDTTEIIGALPQGWEAELYQDGRLLSFTDMPDANGNYVFSDVPLQLGYNRLSVRLFGPYGETSERIVSQFVGGTQCPENELRYTLGIIDPHQQRVSMSEDEDGDLNPALNFKSDEVNSGSAPYTLASLEYGLSQHLSARLDASHYFQSGDYNAALSLYGSFKSIHGGIRLAGDETGAQAYEAFFQSRLSQRTSLSTHWSDYGPLISEYSGEGPSRLMHQGRMRLDTQVSSHGRALPIQATLTWNARESGETNLSAQAVTASNFKGVNWSNNLRYSNTQTANRNGYTQIDGSLLTSKNLKGFRMRAGLNYDLTDGFDVSSVSASVQRNFNNKGIFQASTVYDMQTKSAGLEAVFTKSFRQFSLSSRAGISQSGQWQAGVNLAFSLYKPDSSKFYNLSAPGLSRSGAVRLLSFEDMDSDRQPSAGDIASHGTKYIIANSLRSERADLNGASIISGIDTYKSTDIELQLSSLEDPFLRPVRAGRAVTLRPGQVVDIAFPLVTSGDVDGVIQMKRDGHVTPLAGVSVEIVDQNGRLIQTGISEYDGYFYVADIPAVTVYARIAQADLDMIEAYSAPVTLDLTRENPTAQNIDLMIHLKAE